MRILLVAPFDNTAQGIIAGYCRNNLQGLGNEVEVFDFRRHPYSESKLAEAAKSVFRTLFPAAPSPYDFPEIRVRVDKKINELLQKKAFAFKPEMVLVFCGENISAETLELIRREFKSRIAIWMLDTLFQADRYQLMRDMAAVYDHVFLIDSLVILEKVAISFKDVVSLPLGCDSLVHRKIDVSALDLKAYGSDVAFVGTVTPPREKLLKELAEFDLKIWGRWQKVVPGLEKCYQKKDIYAQEAVKVYNASKIIVDMHSYWEKGKVLYNVTPRVFEVPASGGFLLTNPSEQLKDLYDVGRELVVYEDIRDLKRLIRYYLDNPGERMAIASKGHEKAQKEHTYEQRLKRLIETVRKSS